MTGRRCVSDNLLSLVVTLGSHDGEYVHRESMYFGMYVQLRTM